MGLIIAVITGIIDASGSTSLIITNFNVILIGISNALSNNLLTFKIAFTILAFNMFLIAGLFKLYFVNYKGKKHMYQNNFVIQLIYIESIIYGFFCIVLIGAVGGLFATGSTILTQIPIINQLLPGGNPIVLGIFLILPAIIALVTILSGFFVNRKKIVSTIA